MCLHDFAYPGKARGVLGWSADGMPGFAPNYPFDTGYASQPGPFPEETAFRNDVKRTDEQFGVFGEVTFDLSDQFSVVLGGRYYDIEVDLDGSANSSFCNFSGPNGTDADSFGTDISDIFNGDGEVTFRNSCDTSQNITYTQADVDNPDVDVPAKVAAGLKAPDVAKSKGSIFKVTGNWTPTDSALFYATISEGFRPGLLNRPGGDVSRDGNFTVPFELDTDEVMNYELGWKTDVLDYTLRFNGSLFFVDIENLQTTIQDPSITNLFFSDNAANAKVRGMEFDFVWGPESVPGLTASGGASLLDTEITEVLTPTNDVRKGDSLAFAPEVQFNMQARYEWDMGGMTAHVMPHVTHSGESYSDIILINRTRIDSWTMLGVTAGLTADKWFAELFVDNLTDERAELSANFINDRNRVSYAQPLTAGIRLGYNF